MHKEGDRLVIEPKKKKEMLLEILKRLGPLEEEFPEIDDPLPEPFDL